MDDRNSSHFWVHSSHHYIILHRYIATLSQATKRKQKVSKASVLLKQTFLCRCFSRQRRPEDRTCALLRLIISMSPATSRDSSLFSKWQHWRSYNCHTTMNNNNNIQYHGHDFRMPLGFHGSSMWFDTLWNCQELAAGHCAIAGGMWGLSWVNMGHFMLLGIVWMGMVWPGDWYGVFASGPSPLTFLNTQNIKSSGAVMLDSARYSRKFESGCFGDDTPVGLENSVTLCDCHLLTICMSPVNDSGHWCSMVLSCSTWAVSPRSLWIHVNSHHVLSDSVRYPLVN